MWSVSPAFANSVEKAENPPDLSIVGDEQGTLLYNKYGTWGNVSAVSDNKVASIDGIALTGSSNDLNFTVQGTTYIHLIGAAEDNGASGNVQGIRIESSANAAENGKVINAHLQDDVTIYAESTDPQMSRAKGIWVYGGHDFLGGDEHKETAGSTLTIDGNLNVTAISKGFAIGINVGDEFGDANGHGTGFLTLNGERNVVKVEQTSLANNGSYARGSVGILGSNQAHITINSKETEILTKTHHTGLATTQGGVVLENASSLTVANRLSIDSTATNASALNSLYGISVDRNADIVNPNADGSVVRLNGFSSVTLQSNRNTNAWGFASYGKGSLIADGHLSVALDVDQEDIGGIKEFSAVYAGTSYTKGYAKNGGEVQINGGLEISLPESVRAGQSNIYALNASGENYALDRNPTITAEGDESDVFHLNGNVNAALDGQIKLAMSNSDSFLTGWADNHVATDDLATNDGVIDFSLNNGAVWNVISKVNTTGAVMSETSSVDTLNLGGGLLNMSYASQSSDANDDAELRQVLILTGTAEGQGLTGNGGTIGMDINLADEGSEAKGLNLDQIIVKGSTEGTHALSVNFINGLGNVSEDKWYSENWLIEQEAGSMTLTGPNGTEAFAGRGMVSVWNVKFVPEGEDGKLETDRDSLDNTSEGKPNDGKGHWYLVRQDKESGEITDNITIGTSASQALAYLADLEDLRKRLGEVRYGAQAGAWAKAFAKQDSVNASGNRGFKQEVYGINIGFDSLVGTSEHASWLIGGAFRYSNADQEGVGIGGTTGDLDEYSVKGYATWMHEKGSYADFVVQAGRYEQELDGFDNTGTGRSHADYGTWGFGASVEVGHMFSFGNDADDRRWFNHWFVEPQLELSYFHAKGADYSTSTGLKVDQEDADFLTGRAGVVVGKKFNYGTIDDLDRRYFQIALIGGVKHEFLGGDQTIRYTGVDGIRASVKADDIAETRFYYGLTADWQVSNRLRLYAQLDREEGDHYTKDYDVSVGFKYSF